MRETAAWVGRRIREAREAAGLSQVELAAALGKTQTAVSQWEGGKRAPALDDLVQISETTGNDVRELMPPSSPREPVHMLMRAAVADLSPELAQQLQEFVLDAEAQGPMEAVITVSADRPLRAAQEVLSRGQLVDPEAVRPPVDVEALALMCGVTVLHRRFHHELAGLLVEIDHHPVIGVNKAQNPVGRRRFSLAHELGHHVLRHHDRFHLDLGTVADGNPPTYDWRLEREANDFAANVLMPADEVRRCFEASADVPDLAERFGVSRLAMGYRLRGLGLRDLTGAPDGGSD
ncbi:MAG: XRE family transcriptional regulator [Thermoleophilaceae bacterium]